MIWSFVLTFVGITGFLLAGQKVWWAWHVNVGCQVLWVAYAIATEQWGFIIAAAFYTLIFGLNARRWTREHRAASDRPPERVG